MNLRRGLATGAGIVSAVAIGIVLNSGDRASAVGPPPDGNYTFNQAGVSGVTWTITALCDQVNGSRYYKDYSNPDIQADFCALNIVSATSEQISRQDNCKTTVAEPGLSADSGPSRRPWTAAFPARAAAQHRRLKPTHSTTERSAGTHTSLARRRMRSAASDEQATVLPATGRSPAQPDPALPVAVQQRCHLLLSIAPGPGAG